MLSLSATTRVYLRPGATDLRLGFEALYQLARTSFGQDPLSGGQVFECPKNCTRLARKETPVQDHPSLPSMAAKLGFENVERLLRPQRSSRSAGSQQMPMAAPSQINGKIRSIDCHNRQLRRGIAQHHQASVRKIDRAAAITCHLRAHAGQLFG